MTFKQLFSNGMRNIKMFKNLSNIIYMSLSYQGQKMKHNEYFQISMDNQLAYFVLAHIIILHSIEIDFVAI